MPALLQVDGTDDGRRERDADGVGEAGVGIAEVGDHRGGDQRSEAAEDKACVKN